MQSQVIIKNIINEVIIDLLFEGRIGKNIKPYEVSIINSVIEYMKSKFQFDADISINKISSDILIGDITLNSDAVNHNKFTLSYDSNQGINMMISSIIHELTHIKQVSKGELNPSEDYNSILWGNDYSLPVTDYNNITNRDEHKKLPWEAEAYNNMKLINDFKSSSYWADLKGKDATLDFIIDNS